MAKAREQKFGEVEKILRKEILDSDHDPEIVLKELERIYFSIYSKRPTPKESRLMVLTFTAGYELGREQENPNFSYGGPFQCDND